jgi:hypothetical protein
MHTSAGVVTPLFGGVVMSVVAAAQVYQPVGVAAVAVIAAEVVAPPKLAQAAPQPPAPQPPAPQPPAPQPPAGTKSTPVTNDVTNYLGDRVSFLDDLLVKVEGDDGQSRGVACLPARTSLRGGTGYTDGNEKGSLFRIISTGNPPERLDNGFLNIKKRTPRPCNKDLYDPKQITYTGALSEGTTVRITQDQMQRSPPSRYGLTYGLLAVPFKYHLTGAKDFTGSATLGSYLGYRTDHSGNGFGLAFVGFVGGSSIPVTSDVNGKTTTQNFAGLSYGLGIVGTVKGNFQCGAVLGFDRVSSSANYQYNGKAWLGFQLGYSFLQ